MTNHLLMFRTFTVLASSCVALLLGACSEKSEAEKADDERASVREEKRKRAVQLYQTLAKEYPDHPKAEEAKQRAAALEALAPKK
jgi:hypothetical protein